MAKQRNSDIEIWRDPWFRKLSPIHKCFWKYLCDNADDSGVWKEDLELASFQIGQEISKEDALKAYNNGKDRIIEFKSGYWFIKGFIPFHYGAFNADNNFQNKIRGLIQSHGIEGLVKGCLTLKDKGKTKTKVKTLLEEKIEKEPFTKPNLGELTAAFKMGGLDAASAPVEAKKFLNHFETVGWVVGRSRKPMKSWRGAVATWIGNHKEWRVSAAAGLTKQQQQNLKQLEVL